MRARAHLHGARALVRARIPWVVLAAAGAALYPRIHPGLRAIPEAGLVLAGCAVALVLSHGAVERRLHAGPALLWIQKPGRPATFYAGRLGILVLLVYGVHGLTGLGLAWTGSGPTAPSPGLLATLALLDLAVVSVAFCLSAAGVPLAPLAALLCIVFLGLPGADAALDPRRFGAWNAFVSFQRFPVLEIRALRRWMESGGPAPSPTALARPLLYAGAWVVLGVILVEARLRAPGWWREGRRPSREPAAPTSPAPPPARAPRV